MTVVTRPSSDGHAPSDGSPDRPRLGEILDTRSLQALMDEFYKLVRVPLGVLDLEGNVLVGVGWQDICTKFHRVHPETCKHCVESDTQLTAGVPAGEFKVYKCKNGMWDVATPLIVSGQHAGNIFVGQFFFEDEVLDREAFRAQAARYGFDEAEYLRALEAVPRLSRDSVAGTMGFFVRFAEMLSQLGHSNMKLARAHAEREALMTSLQRAKVELEEADERKSALLATLSQQRATLLESRSYLERIIDSVADPIFVKDRRHRQVLVNDAFCRLVGRDRSSVLGRTDYDFLPKEEVDIFLEKDELVFTSGQENVNEERLTDAQGNVHVLVTKKTLYTSQQDEDFIVGIIRDVTEARRLEMELQQAQKLEAVGRLAAGIAHELNTPMQFIGDNCHFTQEVFAALDQFARAAIDAARPEAREALLRLHEQLDLEYLRSEAPKTFERTRDGIQRVLAIVRAMKEFAHPDRTEMVAVDLNRCVRATIEIARNEYKYVADVETVLGDLPLVTCHAGEVNQVVLNLLVNAGHSIADAVLGTEGRGKIRVTTARDGDRVLVTISDTGKGIPEAVRGKVFEPFFTTKPVGRGTGQGLAIAQAIVRKHEGRIWFQTESGKGTTFFIQIPITPRCSRGPG